jgi:hypothetical protein
MQISSVLNSSANADAVTYQDSQTSSSFASCFLNASDSSTGSDSTVSDSDSSDSAIEEFMAYAKETPAERMFDNWLGSQHMTMAQYNSMTTAQKQAITNEYNAYMKQELNSQVAGLSSTTATVSSASI